MPAARRYKQSLVDELKAAISALPPGTPPEPEVTRDEVLQQLETELHRKIIDENVDVTTVVDMLNARGIRVSPGQIRGIVKPKSKKSRKAKAPATPRARRAPAGVMNSAPGESARGGGSQRAEAGFQVRPDGDDI